MADGNKIIIRYQFNVYGREAYDARRAYSDGRVVYTGYRQDALEYFRNLHPSKSIIFIGSHQE